MNAAPVQACACTDARSTAQDLAAGWLSRQYAERMGTHRAARAAVTLDTVSGLGFTVAGR
jgi:hypothetical protein